MNAPAASAGIALRRSRVRILSIAFGVVAIAALAVNYILLSGPCDPAIPLSPKVPLGKAPASPDFVSVDGTRFSLHGRPFYFQGTNVFSAAVKDHRTEKDLRALFQFLDDHELSVVRLWSFSNGELPNIRTFQPRPGEFDEDALQWLDLTLAVAAEHDMRLILPLVNFEDAYHGMQWYVDELLGPGRDKELFYTDPQVREAYRAYARMLIERTNTVTGKAYRDDPVILAWELANEPHTRDNYERGKNLPPGSLLFDWLVEMSAFVKSLDPNHLVCSGEEGYRSDCRRPGWHAWLHNGLKGEDFVRNSTIETLDFMTVHIYPDNWGIPVWNASWVNDHFVRDRARIAHAAGKPIIMEEYGSRPGYKTRDEILRSLHAAAHDAGYAGTLVWQFLPPPSEIPGNFDPAGYDFTPSDDGFAALRDQTQLMRSKNAP